MALESTQIVINEHDYQITAFPARKALMVKAKLAKALMPFISGALTDNSKSAESLEAIAGKVATSLNPEEFGALALELLSYTMRDSKVINDTEFDKIYSRNFSEFYKIAIEIVKWNYNDFLELATTLVAKK